MISNRDYKFVGEKFWIKGSIVDAPLEVGEIVQISGSSVVAVDKNSLSCSTTLLDQSTICITDTPNRTNSTDTCLAIMVRAGDITKTPYEITFTMATTEGQIFQVKGQMNVK